MRAAWARFFAVCDHPNAFHSSIAWAEYVAHHGAAVKVAAARAPGGDVGALAPVVYHRFPLQLGGGLLVANILGSTPLGLLDPAQARALVDCLLDARRDCDAVLFDSLPLAHPCWQIASAAPLMGYAPIGTHAAHMLDFPPSFADYVRGLKPRFRYNVQRATRTLRQAAGGLELVRCRSPEQAGFLFEAAARVRQRSWQAPLLGSLDDDKYQSSRAGLLELARRGLLRSYVLQAGGTPCAFVIGYQHRDVYFYAVPGYDRAYSQHSPGSALLYLMLEDLCQVERPRFLSFGRGDDAYKRRFGNRHMDVGRLLVLRSTLKNRVRVWNHRAGSTLAHVLRSRLPVRRGIPRSGQRAAR